MSAGPAAATATTSARFILDKPLHELTEDDVSQLTREDCRRYLHDKGMRRPSWNKSQAIQQVISLKSLLEPPPPRPPPPVPEALPRLTATNTGNGTPSLSSSLKELSPVDGEALASASERSKEQHDARDEGVDAKGVSPRSLDTTDLSQREMTILYSGKVNVYERVPEDQAQTILHLVSTPMQFHRDEQTSRHSAHWAAPIQLHPSNSKFRVCHSRSTVRQPFLTGIDGHLNRQVCLQKYREKKNDRERFKIRERIGPPGLDLYLNHHFRGQSIGQSSGSTSNFLNRPGQVHGLPNFLDNLRKNPNLSVVIKDRV
ncbi:TIFY 4B-like protein [Drosera capensis]